MKKLIEQLTATEAAVKALADQHPANAPLQALRGRVRAALELCEHVKLPDPVKPPTTPNS